MPFNEDYSEVESGNSYRPTVFLSYRYKDAPRFDVIQHIASRLRFYSFNVILDQKDISYGDDIREFMQSSISAADAILIILTEDYNQALLAKGEAGTGVRFEVECAFREKEIRPDFQIIPVLLEDVRPVSPFDSFRCVSYKNIDEIAAQLMLKKSRDLNQRYRIDTIIEQRGMASIYEAYDSVIDLPVEIYQVPLSGIESKYLYSQFERMIKGRSAAFSPFLLNVRDTHFDHERTFFIITEAFRGTDLQVFLGQGRTTHPFGALLIVYQAALAIHELHRIGIVHNGLAPRCLRLNHDQTVCKIMDFEFAIPLADASQRAREFEGYPFISPPERFRGEPASIQHDLYQLGNLIFHLIYGRPIVSRYFLQQFRASSRSFPIASEDSDLHERISLALQKKLEENMPRFLLPDKWMSDKIRSSATREFIEERLAALIAKCVSPDPNDRPKSAQELIGNIVELGIPASGYLINSEGVQISNGLFP